MVVDIRIRVELGHAFFCFRGFGRGMNGGVGGAVAGFVDGWSKHSASFKRGIARLMVAICKLSRLFG